jgi:hypothetical protein
MSFLATYPSYFKYWGKAKKETDREGNDFFTQYTGKVWII